MTPTLRDYQETAVERVLSAPARRTLLVAPCGAGKTVIAAEVIRRRGSRTLFLAAQRELIEQTAAKLTAANVAHGIIMAGVAPRPAPVQVASVQTLARRGTLPAAELVVIDEADLARADTYSRILDHYPHASVVGMTGTPWRSDGKGLGELFDDSFVVATPRELIERGYLVDFGGARFDPLDTSGIKTVAGDFDKGELGDRATRSEQGRRLAGDLVREYLARTPGRRAACFAVNIEHSRMLAQQFRDAGVPAEHVDGAMPQPERAAILDRVRSGETLVLCNYGIVTRGVDIPALEVAILARPTKSLPLYLQCVGRVLRPSPGKDRALILDHAGLTATHGFPDDDRDYSLTVDGKRRAGLVDAVAIRRCPACFCVTDGAEACPECGASLVRPRAPSPLRTVDGVAVDFDSIRAAARSGGEAVELRDLIWDGKRRGKPDGLAVSAASFIFNRAHGRYPSSESIAAAKRLAGLGQAVAA